MNKPAKQENELFYLFYCERFQAEKFSKDLTESWCLLIVVKLRMIFKMFTPPKRYDNSRCVSIGKGKGVGS